MSGYNWYFYSLNCCNTGGSGACDCDTEITAAKDEILAAVAALQADVDGVVIATDAIEDAVVNPSMC